MKKTLALVLAALMTAGMTTVAFAAKAGDVNAMLGYAVNEGGDLVYATDVYYVLDSDDVAKLPEGANVEGGDEIAIPLVQWTDVNGDGNAITDADDTFEWYRDTDDLKKPNVYTDWRIGNADAEIRMVKYGAGDYRYSVVVTVPENDTNKPVDLEGKIMVGRTKNAAEDAIYGSFDLGVTYAPAAEVVKTYEGETLEAGKTGIYKFDSEDGEIDIEFGDQAMFTVDVTGQRKLNLAWNTDFDKEFAAMYDYANIDFVTFEGTPAFNKTGTLYIYADEDEFVYEVTADGAKAVKAEWNEDYEAWELKTRTLKSYAISDVELDEKTETEDKKDDSSSTTDGGKTNPDTGR